MRYWIQERRGLRRQAHYGLSGTRLSADRVTRISPSEAFTVDLTVENTENYLSNSYVSHNTASLVVGSSSGVHGWHSRYYIRRIRALKNEPLYLYLAENLPEVLEDDYFKPATQAVISIPVKAPEGAITREEPATDLLKRVAHVYQNWIRPGHRKGANHNNVSTTVTVKPDEWAAVGKWMWEHRKDFTAISVLPEDGGSYVQAPFEEISEAEYKKREKHLHAIDLSMVVEFEDMTAQKEQAACAGGACEIT